MAASAVAAGSATIGAGVMGAFALGAVPALIAAQLSAQALARLPRAAALAVQRGLPLLAALVLIYRAALASSHHSCH
jgi:sulfite exporter TauE/SafE